MKIELDDRECFIVRLALRTYAAELEKTAKAEEKVGVQPTEVRDRLNIIHGSADESPLIAKFEDQTDMFGVEVIEPEPIPNDVGAPNAFDDVETAEEKGKHRPRLLGSGV